MRQALYGKILSQIFVFDIGKGETFLFFIF